MVWFRRKQPATRRGGEATAGSTRETAASSEGRKTGFDPYDTAPGGPRASSPRRQRTNPPTAPDSHDPYRTAERRPRSRSWDDALIDTWVDPRPRR